MVSNIPTLLPSRPALATDEPLLATLPFRFRLPAETRTKGRDVFCREYDVRGLAGIWGSRLVLEWSGNIRVTDVHGFATDLRQEPFPAGRRSLPLATLLAVTRRGWWWRPRVELEASTLGAFEGVPSATGAKLSLVVGLTDLEAAGRLVIAAQPLLGSRPTRGRDRRSA